MRWFARRLVFYVFALWVALTINFLLPRMMPGSPIDGILQHLTPAQLAANPGIVKTYEALVGGGNNSIWQDYVTYLSRIVHLDFGVSTSHYPTPVSTVVGQTLPYSIFLNHLPIVPLFIGPRWSTYSTRYFHCYCTKKNFFGDPIFTTFPDNILSFTRICPGGKVGP